MSRLGVLRGRRDRSQRPAPGSEHRGLRRAHLWHALVTRTPTSRQRAGTRRLEQRGRSPDPHPPSLLIGPSRRRTSQVGDPHAHVIAATRAAQKSGWTRSPGSWQCPGSGATRSPRGDERDAVVPTSPLTLSAGSFTRNARTRAESRTGPPSAPPKGWPTSLTSTRRGAGSSAGRSPRR